MEKYDFIIVLGTQPDTCTWEFPKQIHQCLDAAAQLFKNEAAPYVITSGGVSIGLDRLTVKQPFLESDEMKKMLVGKGVPPKSIISEGKSRDTISNLYFIKEELLIPCSATSLLFVVAAFRVQRLTFLCRRILGPSYSVKFEEIPTGAHQHSSSEKTITDISERFLMPMEDGDHEWLKDKFFESWPYQ